MYIKSEVIQEASDYGGMSREEAAGKMTQTG